MCGRAEAIETHDDRHGDRLPQAVATMCGRAEAIETKKCLKGVMVAPTNVATMCGRAEAIETLFFLYLMVLRRRKVATMCGRAEAIETVCSRRCRGDQCTSRNDVWPRRGH